jgi:capsular exopolysaccharide synthesis family protein
LGISVELREYLLLLRRRWITVVAATLIGVLLGALATSLSPRVYQAHTKSFVSVTSVTPSDATASIQQASQFSLQRVKSYTELADSVTLLQPVIDELGLKDTVAGLASKVTVTNPLETVILEVTVSENSPRLAADVANAVADRLSTVIEQLEPPVNGKALIKVTVTKRAVPIATPVSPRPTLNLALGFIVGMVIGIGAAVLRQQFDRSVRTPRDVRSVVGANPLGVIARFPRRSAKPLVATTPASAGAQSFRALRTSLHLLNGDHPPRSIVVTSAVGGEGRTVTACNLAITMAQSGASVCLVEADLRRPAIATYLQIEPSVGIGEVLSDPELLDVALIPWRNTGLTVLSAGGRPIDPTEMLASPSVHELFQVLSRRFDMVVIDTPPLLPVADAQVLAAVTDGALVVARHGATARSEFAEAVSTLQTAGVRILGAALVGVPNRDAHSYAYGYRETAWKFADHKDGNSAEQAGPSQAESFDEADDALVAKSGATGASEGARS